MSRKTAAKKKSGAKRAAKLVAVEQAGAAIPTADSYRKDKVGFFNFADGTRFIVRRPRPETAMRLHRLPSDLRMRAMESAAGKQVQLIQTPEEEMAFMEYARALVADVCVRPRVEVGAKDKGVLDVDDLSPFHFWSLFNFAERGGDLIPLDTEGGGLTVEELENFRGESELPNASQDVSGRHWETTPTARNL
jgi:hypothetical protein